MTELQIPFTLLSVLEYHSISARYGHGTCEHHEKKICYVIGVQYEMTTPRSIAGGLEARLAVRMVRLGSISLCSDNNSAYISTLVRTTILERLVVALREKELRWECRGVFKLHRDLQDVGLNSSIRRKFMEIQTL